MNCHKVFRYQPLDTTKREIRLVKLVSIDSARDDPSLSVEHYTLDSAPPFKALSYCWGTFMTAWPIELNGGSIQVRRSLHQFLKILQQQLDHGYYWVDQLCIDQSSTKERNHQVAFMKDIYARAEETVVSLYSDSYSDSPASVLEFLQGLNMPKEQDYGQHVHDKEMIASKVQRFVWSHPDSLKIFLCNPYWSRLWIVQEILLAKKVSLACRTGPCMFSRLELLIPHLTKEYMGFGRAIVWFLTERNPLTGGFDLPVRSGLEYELAYLVSICETRNCGDERDRIFALQGLVTPSQRITVNYNFPLEQIAVEAINIIIRTDSKRTPKLETKVDICLRLVSVLLPASQIYVSLQHLAIRRLGETEEKSKERIVESFRDAIAKPRKFSPEGFLMPRW